MNKVVIKEKEKFPWKKVCAQMIELNGHRQTNTVSFTDLDQGIELIIFESILTTFIMSIVFRGYRGSRKIGSSLKLIHHWQI